MSWSKWVFQAVDSFFFRGPVSFHATEGGYTVVRSIFPPFVTTLQGAIRYALATAMGWVPDKEKTLPRELGDENNLGALSFRGPYVEYKNSVYFPVPSLLLKAGENYVRLKPGPKVKTDLGEVHLPVAPEQYIGALKELRDSYISYDNLAMILQGFLPKDQDLLTPKDLYSIEERVGIGRSPKKHTAMEGYLYYIDHVRLYPWVALTVYVSGIPDQVDLSKIKTVPLGGEGRLATVVINECDVVRIIPPFPTLDCDKDGKLRFFVMLLTPGWFEDPWKVILKGPSELAAEKDVQVVSACIGKSMYMGGWDLKNGEPRASHPIIPPGSLWFYEAKESKELKTKLEKLHGECLDIKKEFGFSQILIGRWEGLE